MTANNREVRSSLCVTCKIAPTNLTRVTTFDRQKFQKNINDNALDISTRGQKISVDIRVNPRIAIQMEVSKKHIYVMNNRRTENIERINEIKHGTFITLVFSCLGGMSSLLKHKQT